MARRAAMEMLHLLLQLAPPGRLSHWVQVKFAFKLSGLPEEYSL